MAAKIEKVLEIPSLLLGEGPYWDIKSQSLYFVDIFGNSINRWIESTKKYTSAKLEKSPHFIIPIKDKPNQFVISYDEEVVIIEWDGESDKTSILKSIGKFHEGKSNVVNDGKCDSTGRLWTGTFGPRDSMGKFTTRQGILYSIDGKTGDAVGHLKEIGLSNGLAFNESKKKLYFIDTLQETVISFDFDVEKGALSNLTTIFTTSKHGLEGSPDGMTIDTDGNLYIALFRGGAVIKINPDKPESLLETIKLPAVKVTSMIWGGPSLDELYVTTGRLEWQDQKLDSENNGMIYKITGLGARGYPENEFQI